MGNLDCHLTLGSVDPHESLHKRHLNQMSHIHVNKTAPLKLRPNGTIQQQQLLLLLHPFDGIFSRTTGVSRYQKGKTSLDINEARDDGVLGCGGISWTICKQSAPRSRQIITPTPHHSIFTGRMLFLTPNQQCQGTEGTVALHKSAYHYYYYYK